MAKVVDARGLPCPQPVILTRNALQESELVTTIVDNETAQYNVTRMVESSGRTVRAERRDDGIYLHVSLPTGGQGTPLQEPTAEIVCTPAGGPLVLLVPADTMGRGDAELGQILVRAFFHTLGEVRPLPQTVVFLNSGVRLVVEGSPVLEDLQNLCGQGITVLACGTCLGHYELKDRLAVGEVSNMYSIAEALMGAGKVVSL